MSRNNITVEYIRIMPRETRASARLAAAAPQTAPVVEQPKPARAAKAPRRNAAATAAAEKAAADLEAGALRLGTLRERQRAASARYYAKHKKVVSERRAATYAQTIGAARRANPADPRPSFPTPAPMQPAQQHHQHQHNHQNHDDQQQFDEQQYDEQQPYIPPDLIHVPSVVPDDQPLTLEFLTAWLTARMKPTDSLKRRAVPYKSEIKQLMRMTGCTDMRECIANPAKVLTGIDNGMTVGTKTKPSQRYALNTRLKMVQLILLLIDNIPVKGPRDIKQAYALVFRQLKVESTDKALEDNTALDKSVIQYSEYKRKIQAEYGPKSKEFLIANLYAELPVRDDFHHLELITAEAAKGDVHPGRNFIVEPDSPKGRFLFIMQDYKTSDRYGRYDFTASAALSNKLRAYIKSYKIKVGHFIFGKVPLSGLVQKMNKSIGIPKTGINYLRHSVISSAFHEGMTVEQRAELLRKMGHSPGTQLAYLRLLELAD